MVAKSCRYKEMGSSGVVIGRDRHGEGIEVEVVQSQESADNVRQGLRYCRVAGVRKVSFSVHSETDGRACAEPCHTCAAVPLKATQFRPRAR